MKKKVDVDIVNLSQKKTEDLVEDPLDDKELRAVLGRQAKIVPYHDLSKYRTIDELMPNQKDAVVLLYENKPMDGHWVGLTKNNGEISFFDPYGEVVDKQLQYSRYSNQRVQGEGDTSLSRLLSTSKLPVFFNDFKYQRDGGGVNTCGRHVSNFIRYNLGEGLDLEDYNEMMMKTHKETGLPYDDLIAKMVPIHIPHPEDAQRKAEGASKPNDLALYEKAKSIVYPRYSKPSAYRSGALQKEYKRLGGTYSDDGGRPLKRWFKEGWKDVGQKKGDYPLYRPTKRISKDTPATASEIGQKRLAEQDRLKQQYKGEKNLPSFSPRGGGASGDYKGGAKTAEEKKAYAREYYRRNREEIVAKARAKRYGYTYRPPEPLYESPFADEENLVEDVVAKKVLASLAKKKADEAEAERAEMARRQKEQVEREYAMLKARKAEEEAEERRREEVRLRSAEYLQKNRDKINAAQRARAAAERALKPPKKPLTAKEQKQKEARERYAAKKKAEANADADLAVGADDYLANLRRNLGFGRLRGGRRTLSHGVGASANLTPVEQVGNYFIKRDDLYEYAGQRGGKVRSALYLIKKGNADCLTTAGNRNSPQINIVSSIGKKLGKPVVAFTSTGELGPEVELAKSKGAVIKQVRPGYETVITRRAKDYAEAKGCDYIPFGMDTPDVHFLTAEQVDNIPNDARRIVIPVGSASSIIGVIKGLMERGDKRKVLGVVVGANPTKKLDKYVPNWRSVASLVFPKLKYHEPATETKFQGIDLDPFYEAKTIPYLKLGDLLWVVGVREGQTGDGEGHEGTDAVKLPAPQFKSELVEAKKSGVKGGGWGLYAKVDIPKGERIAPFYGEEMKWADFTKKYGPYKERSDLHQYAYISRRTGKIILSFKQPYLSKNVVNYINEIPPNFNVELKQKALFAIKDIQKGEELSLEYPVDYDRYWLKGGDGFAE